VVLILLFWLDWLLVMEFADVVRRAKQFVSQRALDQDSLDYLTMRGDGISLEQVAHQPGEDDAGVNARLLNPDLICSYCLLLARSPVWLSCRCLSPVCAECVSKAITMEWEAQSHKHQFIFSCPKCRTPVNLLQTRAIGDYARNPVSVEQHTTTQVFW